MLHVPQEQDLEGRLLPAHTRGVVPWVTITPAMMYSGATLPAHSNVIIHIPGDSKRITRRVLFGRRGQDVRYWGYCFPENYDRAQANTRDGFPGTLFISEAERAVRRRRLAAEQRRTFSVFRNLTEKDLNQINYSRGRVRHQMEVFRPGMSCFVMTEKPLHVGVDEDEDGLNTSLERDFGVNPLSPDSDGDGVTDGLEVFFLGTHPKLRDSDGDCILDGIEDRNQNGRMDPGETDATDIDTDRDNLCDGFCKVNKGTELRGEDKNCNGIVDKGETSPLLIDTDNNNVTDEQEYFNCLAADGDDC